MSGGVKQPLTCSACGTVATVPSGYCASCGAKLTAAPVPGGPDTATNPYAAPTVASLQMQDHRYDPATQREVEAVIKDGGQVWLAVLIGFVCTAVAWIVICPWFLYRLHCWNTLSRNYPALLAPNVPPGSLEARFQSARSRLIVGVVIGAVMLFMFFGAIVAAIVA